MIYIITSFNALSSTVKHVLAPSPPSFHFPIAQDRSQGERGKWLVCSEADLVQEGLGYPEDRHRAHRLRGCYASPWASEVALITG